MADKYNYHLGIDLGTTNSVIAYVNVLGDRLAPNVLDVPRRSRDGNLSREHTLPSAVYYEKKRDDSLAPVVGDFAKAQYGKKYGYVVKSVKSSMGTDKVPDIADELPDKQPEAVSAQILKTLLAGAKQGLILAEMPRDVVITIPASFDSDMRRATLDAAQMAGIDAYDGDGRPLDILLYEPKAALYDFVNRQKNGEIPSQIMDLSAPKNLLVYDIGGGTLDVTLSEVKKSPDTGLLSIRDIAISRYTRMGGDDFDELIAEALKRRFLALYPEIRLTPKVEKEIITAFIRRAEDLKIAMSRDKETFEMRGEIISPYHEVEVMDMNIYDGLPFDEVVTLAELLDMIKPLMAEHLTLGDAARFPSLTSEQDINNIIYPVLDVLCKARQQQDDIKVDYVLLNGGMSKFFAVRDRLRQLFGFEPIILSDPDLSVARGAALYHYYLHQYAIADHFRQVADAPTAAPQSSSAASKYSGTPVPSSLPASPKLPGQVTSRAPLSAVNFLDRPILNDTINFATYGGYVIPLAKAGTPLPYSTEVFDQLYFPKESDSYTLALYAGSGSRTEPPNRRIASRRLTFKRHFPENTGVSIQMEISRLGLIKFHSWITSAPNEHASVSLSYDSATPAAAAAAPRRKAIKAAKPIVSSGITVSFARELNNLLSLYKQRNINRANTAWVKNKTQEIKNCISLIRQADNKANSGALLNAALEAHPENSEYIKTLIGIGAVHYHAWTDVVQRGKFHRFCRAQIDRSDFDLRYAKTMNMQRTAAINALGRIGDAADDELLNRIIAMQIKAYSPLAAVNLAKIGGRPDRLIEEYLKLEITDVAYIDSYAWALARLCSRECSGYNDIAVIESLARQTIKLLQDNGKKNPNFSQTLTYALAELCDSRPFVSPLLPDGIRDEARGVLKYLSIWYFGHRSAAGIQRAISTCESLMEGENLSAENASDFLKWRAIYDTDD